MLNPGPLSHRFLKCFMLDNFPQGGRALFSTHTSVAATRSTHVPAVFAVRIAGNLLRGGRRGMAMNQPHCLVDLKSPA
jgi:hypothetical protein